MFFTTYKGKNRIIALAKETPFIDGHPIYEPGEVYFEFGMTAIEALDKLKQSLRMDGFDLKEQMN